MLASFAKALPFFLAAQAVIFAGVFFINGQLLPALLSRVYESTGVGLRTAIALITAFTIGNLMMATGYKNFGPALAAPATLVATVVVQVVFSAFILGIRPSWLIVPAVGVVIAGCLWVNHLLAK